MDRMISPEAALLWFAALVALAALLAWPRWGVLAQWQRFRSTTERVRIEDALKHLLNCELASGRASVASLAGMLEISPARAHAIVARLDALDLAQPEPDGIALTAEGRAYALRILRTHRLLERYFADRTGAAPSEWHDLAEAGEHALSAEDAEELSALMGHPAYDPHGDPIPSATGVLPPDNGVPLVRLAEGETGTVIHVEDEPAAVYRELLSKGVNVSVPVQVVRTGPHALDVVVDGERQRIDLLAASAISVVRVPAVATEEEQPWERLDVLRPGEQAEVVRISPAVQGPQRRRLLDLGILRGTTITAAMRSASGDPTAYRIRGALIALRRAQARGIHIRRLHVAEGAVAVEAIAAGAVAEGAES